VYSGGCKEGKAAGLLFLLNSPLLLSESRTGSMQCGFLSKSIACSGILLQDGLRAG